MTTAQWEEAWGEYIEALRQFDRTFPARFKRGQVRLHNASKERLGRARKALERLDPQFMESLEGAR